MGWKIEQRFSDLEFNVSLPDDPFYVESLDSAHVSGQGSSLLAARNWEAAVKEYREGGPLTRTTSQPTQLGYAYVGIGDEAGAIAEFEQVIMLAPMIPWDTTTWPLSTSITASTWTGHWKWPGGQ